MLFKSCPSIYDAGPALNKHSVSSTQSPAFMRLSLRLRLRRVHKAAEPTSHPKICIPNSY